MLKGKKILIGITASIAAYKIPLLVRLLKKQGAEVQVLMTPAAHDFVTPLTLATLSERPVLTEPFDKKTGAWNSHIELGYWADLFLIAPASANTLSGIAAGRGDNLLLAVYLAARCPVYIAPAMDVDMFQHAATQDNIKLLQKRGNRIIEPASGHLASGLCGAGRLEEPEKIAEIVQDFFLNSEKLKGKKILITAGPTHEPIDPVRFIGNYSSGKMGFALAESAAEMGAEVVLVSGPVHLNISHPNIALKKVQTAEQMFEECKKAFPDCHAAIMSAAVADFRPDGVADQKIKKENLPEGAAPAIKLKQNPDILQYLGSIKNEDQYLVGFALETDNELENARKKLLRKKCDLIVLNSMRDKGAGFNTDTNKVSLVSHDAVQELELKPKKEVARDLIHFFATALKRKNNANDIPNDQG